MRDRFMLLGLVLGCAAGCFGVYEPPYPPPSAPSQFAPDRLAGSWVLRLRTQPSATCDLDTAFTLLVELRGWRDNRRGLVHFEADSSWWQDSLSGRTGKIGGQIRYSWGGPPTNVNWTEMSWSLSDTTSGWTVAAHIGGQLYADRTIDGYVQDPSIPEYGERPLPVFVPDMSCRYDLVGNHR